MALSYARLALVSSMMDALSIEFALKAAEIPYLRQNRSPLSAYNDITLLDQYTFLVPQELLDRAIEAVSELYEVDTEHFPSICPACNAPTARGKFDCPECGLHLV
jgi:hypothetical protein